MELIDYKVGDEVFIKELFELVFKQNYSIALWRWRFENNPAGQRKIKLMWENDKLIGQYAVSPVDVIVNGSIAKSALSLGTMTHPEYEGKGVFKNLAKSLYESLKLEGYIGVWGFPNNNSHGGFVHSLGWSNLGVQHSLAIASSSLKGEQNAFNLTEFEISTFNISHQEFIQSFQNSSHSIYVMKSYQYLNWRYCEKPEVNYHKYFGTINGTQFLIVFKIFQDSLNNKIAINILELYLKDFSVLHTLLTAIFNNLKLNIDVINIWKSLFNTDHLKLERVGFKLSTPQTYVGILPFIENSETITSYTNWNLNMGDSDVF